MYIVSGLYKQLIRMFLTQFIDDTEVQRLVYKYLKQLLDKHVSNFITAKAMTFRLIISMITKPQPDRDQNCCISWLCQIVNYCSDQIT